jgi:hypothetical protein
MAPEHLRLSAGRRGPLPAVRFCELLRDFAKAGGDAGGFSGPLADKIACCHAGQAAVRPRNEIAPARHPLRIRKIALMSISPSY